MKCIKKNILELNTENEKHSNDNSFLNEKLNKITNENLLLTNKNVCFKNNLLSLSKLSLFMESKLINKI